uniref:Wsv423-like protein n=1 Tax=Metapenaeus joyneri majanivirus TaxID=2984280 RepID=A0A9C7F866_9VIRU|nr:MAG: wsv423-like protein [Metapenaeus joyneri majanivirus]
MFSVDSSNIFDGINSSFIEKCTEMMYKPNDSLLSSMWPVGYDHRKQEIGGGNYFMSPLLNCTPLLNCDPIRIMVNKLLTSAATRLSAQYKTLQVINSDKLFEYIGLGTKTCEHNFFKIKKISFLSIIEMAYKSESAPICKIKKGIYFLPTKNSILKFLTNTNIVDVEEFVREIFFGTSLLGTSQVVSISFVCPEAFCFEIPLMGLPLNFIISKKKEYNKNIYQLLSKVLEINLKADKKETAIITSKGTTTVREPNMKLVIKEKLQEQRNKFLSKLPNIIEEMINILIYLENKNLVYLDIKPDNFILDIKTSQPYLMNTGRIVEINTHLNILNSDKNDNTLYNNIPPELFSQKRCYKKSMTYSFAYLIMFIIEYLHAQHYDGVYKLSDNQKFQKWLIAAKNTNINQRPHLHELIPILKEIFVWTA